MSGIIKIDQKYDLCITQSAVGHGVSGHLYEIIDYYLLLKNHFSTCILIPDDTNQTIILEAIQFKYDLNQTELDDLTENIIYHIDPKIIICNNILVVDGYYGNVNGNCIIRADNIFMFACPVQYAKSRHKNHYVLQDYRIYNEGENTIDYIKKINFDRLKPLSKTNDNILLYGTSNCRMIAGSDFDEISNNNNDKKIICITDVSMENTYKITYLTPPVNNIFELFDTYIYTPVSVKFDCSPRFIAECKYFNKKVIYHNIDYVDDGLLWRRWDIDNNFNSLFLNDSDEIINIIGDKIG